jgi:capsular exopolysaccharide synthesis family protein
MSRVFDALRKAESESGKRVADSPDTFFGSHALAREPLPVNTETIQVLPEDRVVVHSAPHSMGGERFRQLKTYLTELRAAGTLKTILVASPSPQDGKSTVATNLATVLSEKGKYRVLLLEADLRRPSIAAQLRLKSSPGLTECLRGKSAPMAAIRRIEPLGIYVLCAGEPSNAPLELLQSEPYSDLMTLLTTHFDWIVVDAPPVVPVPDTMVLKKVVDATLLVARAGQTTGEALDETIKQFQGSPVLGVVINCAEKLEGRYAKYYGRKENAGEPS